jgi:stage V sporulation protein SpoVS
VSEEIVVLKVGGGSDARKVGSSMAHHVAEGKAVVLRAIGASAVNQVQKAVALSSQWTAPRGHILATVPSFTDVEGRDGSPITAIEFRVV